MFLLLLSSSRQLSLAYLTVENMMMSSTARKDETANEYLKRTSITVLVLGDGESSTGNKY